ncbi:hypothetical protein HPB49_012811 [Dermacentor silvarum]|uniref:Uncharacterized protein n=1 Tax=Dermacentor silvarum TaxID=543639 RepID=A0ACB8C9J3_DERSI|nr:hypothetical protein HPB49_012811 [Dermacentor silvarum]
MAEIFLGSRALKILPLAASSAASLFSPTGLIGFTAHYYAYGWHLIWTVTGPILCLPLATHVFVPVLYRLGITSIFEILMWHSGLLSIEATALCALHRDSHRLKRETQSDSAYDTVSAVPERQLESRRFALPERP